MPNLSWLAQLVFFGAYAIGYFTNKTIPHTIWGLLTAIASVVIAVLLLVENYDTVGVRKGNNQA